MAYHVQNIVLSLILALSCFTHCTLATNIPLEGHVGRDANLNSLSSVALAKAEQLVAAAVAKQGEANLKKIADIRRARAPAGPLKATNLHKRQLVEGAPALTDELLAALALVAERDAAHAAANDTTKPDLKPAVRLNATEGLNKRDAASYWLPQLAGKSRPPMGWNPSYTVFRDVTKYGAKGDGKTDDTKAINQAIADGANCGENCLSSSIKGTLIYFPPGTYLISSPINAYYHTQLVGNPLSVPKIQTSLRFVGLGAIQTDVYYPEGNGAEWYINQSNFYRQVRNFVIDITGTVTSGVAGLHWQVAQATSLQNVAIYCSQAKSDNNKQMGMFTENGSGGFMSDVTITGGKYGIYGGNQQYTVRNFWIIGSREACIDLIWDWGWTWSGLYLASCPIGISMINPEDPKGQVAGSTYIMDSTFDNVAYAVYAHFNESVLDSSVITFDNVAAKSVTALLKLDNGKTMGGNSNVEFLGISRSIINPTQGGGGTYTGINRPDSLTTSTRIVKRNYYVRSKPQYENLATSSIVNVKDRGAYGDGVHDDTKAVQSVLSSASDSTLIYFPAGTYLITSTLFVGAHTRMTGSVWSQLAASGSYFADQSNPKPMLRVGNAGDVGNVEISDMLFTAIGALPGLIMVQWNIKASSPGSCGMWDTHFRLGGAYGTKMQVADCPYVASVGSKCVAANIMFHVTNDANGYFENVWAWVADHDIDDAKNTKVSVAAGRGMLFESQGPTWLYGTASEHSMLYQYNFYGTTNTFAGMIQTESPYFQDTAGGKSPGPFAKSIGQYPGDPNFSDGTCKGTDETCRVSWGLMMHKTTNLTITGAGLYSWFGNMAQDCIDTQKCQQRMVWDDGNNGGLVLWHLITIGVAEMISAPSKGFIVLAKNYIQSIGHPYWSILAGYLGSSRPILLSCIDGDTRSFCVDTPLCDTIKTYDNFADMSAATGSIPDICKGYTAMDTFYTVIDNVRTKYDSANNGYDEVFGYYQDYMKRFISEAIDLFMTPKSNLSPDGGDGSGFFECSCISGDCEGEPTQKCPYTRTQAGEIFNINYKLVDSDGFFNGILNAYGIPKDWIEFGKVTQSSTGSSCTPGRSDCQPTRHTFSNYPIIKTGLVIPNPKDVISKSLTTIDSIQDETLSFMVDLDTGAWNSPTDDLLQAHSLPIFMLDQSVKSMEYAKQVGQQEKHDKQVELAMQILTGIFAALPFVTEFAPALAAVRGFATLIIELGNVGLTIAGIVENPESAPMALLGLFSGGIGRDASAVAKVAAARRALKDADITALGDTFKKSSNDFESAVALKCDRIAI